MQKQTKLNSLALSLFCACAISACNGGGAQSPATTSNYGQLIAESGQIIHGSSQVSLANLYATTLYIGNYIESTGEVKYAYESANILNTAQDFKFNVTGAITNPSSYFKASSVSAYVLQYTTPGQNAKTSPSQIMRTVSGLVVLPNLTDMSQLRGVIIYYHPTVFGKNEVPSCISGSSNLPDYCSFSHLDSSGYADFVSLSALFAARGFAVVAPDYLGLGVDWNNTHPYVVYPENNALAGLYMLPSLRKILADKGLAESKELNLFLTGYSEGGGYSLKASQLLQTSYQHILTDNNVALRITSPQEGAYSPKDQMDFSFDDLSDGLFNCANNPDPNFVCGESAMLQADQTLLPTVKSMNQWNIGSVPYVAMTKAPLVSYVLASAMNYNFQNLTQAYDYVMNHQFWAEIPLDNQLLNLYQLYSGNAKNYTGSQISGAILANTYNINNYSESKSYPITFYQSGNSLFSTSLNGHYGANNSGKLFIHYGIINDPQFQQVLTQGITYNWQTKSPINFIYMNYDSTVAAINTKQAYSCMKYAKSYVSVDGTPSSQASCTTNASQDFIESTIINNYQLTNDAIQLSPMINNQVNSYAYSHYWTKLAWSVPNATIFGTPFDHGDMFILGNIVALCSFENMLVNGTNSGVCPSLP
ncbi:MAG: hypothetical protein RLZZ293_15 [Pseudomonadota bacterium]|jgi:hypothetical protein